MLEIKVTLRVFSANYTLAELSAILGMPTDGFSVGDIYGRNARVREETFWSLESSLPSSVELEAHVNEIISFLDGKKELMLRLVDKCEVDLSCMLRSTNGQGGTFLSCDVIEKLHHHKLSIAFDVYASE